jgi:hypothetical protein
VLRLRAALESVGEKVKRLRLAWWFAEEAVV